MLVGVGQQSQKARALDGRVELALIQGAGAGQAGRNDLAVFRNEIAQGVNILVINFFHAGNQKKLENLKI